MIVATCGTCKGKRYVTRPGSSIRDDCPQCGGMGNVPATAARDALIHDVLGERIGGSNAVAALDALALNRTELVDWLVECGILGRTRYGLVPHRELDGWGNAGAERMVAQEVSDGFEGPRLWTVWT